jgi:NitT/TauT family transport system ATP-binding protein
MIEIKKPIDDRGLVDRDLDDYQSHLWGIMHDEARAADAELLDV